MKKPLFHFLGMFALLMLHFVALSQSLPAGLPPYPDELKYPNIVSPKVQFGTYGTSVGDFIDPYGVAISSEGSIFVADTGNGRIQVFSAEGQSLHSWTGGVEGRLVAPTGIAVDGAGRVYVTDVADDTVKVYTKSGKFVRQWGNHGPGEGEFNKPTALAIFNNLVLVADARNDRIQVFETTGTFVRSIGTSGHGPGQLNSPLGVTVDELGKVFVADSENNRIQQFDLDGEYVRQWGYWGSHAGLFAKPNSIAYSDGELFVTDLVNHRMQVFDLEGNFLYQWGRHPAVAHEGHGRVHYPTSIALSPDGKFSVVCESFENRCQLFLRSVTAQVEQVNDSAWWDKETRFHYGTKGNIGWSTNGGPNLLTISEPDTHSVLVFAIRETEPELRVYPNTSITLFSLIFRLCFGI